MKHVSEQIKKIDERLKELDTKIEEILLQYPNIPHESVPVGKDESDNQEIKRWGTVRNFDEYPAKNHWELGEELGILDFKRAAKIGYRFRANSCFERGKRA